MSTETDEKIVIQALELEYLAAMIFAARRQKLPTPSLRKLKAIFYYLGEYGLGKTVCMME